MLPGGEGVAFYSYGLEAHVLNFGFGDWSLLRTPIVLASWLSIGLEAFYRSLLLLRS